MSNVFFCSEHFPHVFFCSELQNQFKPFLLGPKVAQNIFAGKLTLRDKLTIRLDRAYHMVILLDNRVPGTFGWMRRDKRYHDTPCASRFI